ncbi:hypothetical protein CAP31_05905 [Sulfuriferula sp. AH1]|uniref:hypothetical protein n=1 Tax=Sulfuriferula sp. AH1 TaxID=1985873 RepID=UPI000B3B9E3B|nr:hypothetical protein [Sulfuriferula sp. AH1]ARU31263.1 hypothetical protein CAP31_05905 [Sulfuriferula sp. AH1]
MNALKQLEKHLQQSHAESVNPVFKHLITALCLKKDFDLAALYELDYEEFELSLNILKAWRLDRYTKTKERLREIFQLPAMP